MFKNYYVLILSREASDFQFTPFFESSIVIKLLLLMQLKVKGLPNNELWMSCEIMDIVECKVIGDKTTYALNELNVKSV